MDWNVLDQTCPYVYPSVQNGPSLSTPLTAESGTHPLLILSHQGLEAPHVIAI